MPSFDYLRQLSFHCPIPVIWSTVPVHVVQHSGKWSTIPVTSKSSHWGFAADFCTPGEGHEKGGVEGEGNLCLTRPPARGCIRPPRGFRAKSTNSP